MSNGAIAQYLEELARELRLNSAPRRRLLAEATDHLCSSAAELRASGLAQEEAERAAVARFGNAAEVALSFARAAASASARTALAWAATAWAAYGLASGVFILAAPGWLRDFPQGAPSMIALQVGLVALSVSTLRARRLRGSLFDEPRLRLVARGGLVASLALALAAAGELVLALARPAPAPWSEAGGVIGAYAVAAVAALAAAGLALATHARVRALRRRQHGSGDELAPAAAALVDDVANLAPALRRLVAAAVSRPLLACLAVAGAAFLAVALAELSGGNEGQASPLFAAAATGSFEAGAVVVSYLTLARPLGLRPQR